MLSEENRALLESILLHEPQLATGFVLRHEAMNDLMNAVRREERERAIAVLRPFAAAAAVRICGEWRDDERIQGTAIAFYVTFGDLRAASSYITQAEGAEQ